MTCAYDGHYIPLFSTPVCADVHDNTNGSRHRILAWLVVRETRYIRHGVFMALE